MDSLLGSISIDNSYLKMRRTKIIATVGPASSSPGMLKKLMFAGVNVFRINFSHGEAEKHLDVIKLIKKLAIENNLPVATLADLCGPKIRVGKFKNGAVSLRDNSIVYITVKNELGSETVIPSQYKKIVVEAGAGDKVLLNDGALELKILKKNKDKLEARVIRGGILKDHKGMNLPDTKLNISALTAKDRSDVKYCIKAGVDFIALSFAQRARDIADLKKIISGAGVSIPVIAKIEKPEALRNINEILEIADGIMIARGDLGVELPQQKVPLIQAELIKLSIQFSKPVIVATQMLESMIENSRPTRAEVTDVASACLSGADAVMLSGETAVGKYPFETVSMMSSILYEIEANQWVNDKFFFNKLANVSRGNELQQALAIATAQISRDLGARCIAVLTRSGLTARIVSSDKPASPVLAFTDNAVIRRQMNLLWGVYPILCEHEMKFKHFIALAEEVAKKMKLGKKGQYMIVISGLQGDNTAANSLVAHRIN